MKHLRRNAVGTALFFAAVMCVGGPSDAGGVFRIGFGASPLCAIDIVAEQQGYFAAEGLEVALKEYPTGKAAMEAMLSGLVDVATSSAIPVVSNSFNRKDFRIIATTGEATDDVQIVADKTKAGPALLDLKGKSVGVYKGGQPEFAFDMMIAQAGLSAKDVDIVYGEPEALQDLLRSGKITAICTFGSWVDKALEALGDNAITFSDAQLMRITRILAARTDALKKDPASFEKLLRAEIAAEKYIRLNSEAALALVRDRFKLDKNNARKNWDHSKFSVLLNQSLVRDLETVAKWQRDSGQTTALEIPDFLNFMWFDSLERIDPKRVTVIHQP